MGVVCVFCGWEGADMDAGMGTIYHAACVTCPNCGNQGEVLWKCREPVTPGRWAFKCLHCDVFFVRVNGKWVN